MLWDKGIFGVLEELEERLASLSSQPSIDLRPRRINVLPRTFDKVVCVDGGSVLIRKGPLSIGLALSAAALHEGNSVREYPVKPLVQYFPKDDLAADFRVATSGLDKLREALVMRLAAEILDDADLLILDGPLMQGPSFLASVGKEDRAMAEEYREAQRELLDRADRLGKPVVGFVKEVHSKFLDDGGKVPDVVLLRGLKEGEFVEYARASRRYAFVKMHSTKPVNRVDMNARAWKMREGVLSYLYSTSANGLPIVLRLADSLAKKVSALASLLSYRLGGMAELGKTEVEVVAE